MKEGDRNEVVIFRLGVI